MNEIAQHTTFSILNKDTPWRVQTGQAREALNQYSRHRTYTPSCTYHPITWSCPSHHSNIHQYLDIVPPRIQYLMINLWEILSLPDTVIFHPRMVPGRETTMADRLALVHLLLDVQVHHFHRPLPSFVVVFSFSLVHLLHLMNHHLVQFHTLTMVAVFVVYYFLLLCSFYLQ